MGLHCKWVGLIPVKIIKSEAMTVVQLLSLLETRHPVLERKKSVVL